MMGSSGIRVGAAALAVAGTVLLAPAAAVAGSVSGSASPDFVRAGSFTTFRIHCSDNPKSATLTGTPLLLGTDIRMHRTGAGRFALTLRVPHAVMPGTYEIGMQCSNGDFAEAELEVGPHGGADTGDGATAGGPDTMTAVVGGGAIAAAVLGGALLVRRRRSAQRAA